CAAPTNPGRGPTTTFFRPARTRPRSTRKQGPDRNKSDAPEVLLVPGSANCEPTADPIGSPSTVRTASIATRQLTGDPAKARPATPAARSHSPLTLRRLRLASGLILFGYVLTHLGNHALGNV